MLKQCALTHHLYSRTFSARLFFPFFSLFFFFSLYSWWRFSTCCEHMPKCSFLKAAFIHLELLSRALSAPWVNCTALNQCPLVLEARQFWQTVAFTGSEWRDGLAHAECRDQNTFCLSTEAVIQTWLLILNQKKLEIFACCKLLCMLDRYSWQFLEHKLLCVLHQGDFQIMYYFGSTLVLNSP